jgi:hypothetical protein
LAIIALTLDIYLPACRSLKEKRSRLRGLRDRFGKSPGIALSETAFHDRHDRAQWCAVAIGSDRGQLESQLRSIEKYIHEHIDGYMTHVQIESLR